ncbi:MAG: hypothetical protein KA149_08210 [Chitinophagales bacterium]|nr:hypothetical protein [Chitinophagales bacterium]
MKFKASFDFQAYLTTGLSIVLSFAGLILLFIEKDALLLIFSFVGLVCFLYHPTAYTITDTQIIVHRPISNLNILRDELNDVTQIRKGELFWKWRRLYSSGIWGYIGDCGTGKLGLMSWYATQYDNFVLLTLNGKKIMLTPDEPEKFIAALS